MPDIHVSNVEAPVLSLDIMMLAVIIDKGKGMKSYMISQVITYDIGYDIIDRSITRKRLIDCLICA